MVATAAAAATAFAEVFFFGNATEFESFREILIDRLLHLVDFLLGADETGSNGIIHDAFAVFFVVVNFLLAQAGALLLLVVQHFIFFNEGLVLLLGFFIAHELVDVFAQALKIRMVEDGLAEIPGSLHDIAVFRS